MKPGEEMHSSVEEVDVDPCDLYLDLGALIVEGRVPGLTDRGFGEGPHCPSAAGNSQCRHHCNPEALECQRYEQMQKHMLLLWKNSIPMSIEVLLYPNCCVGSTPFQNVDSSSVPDMPYILIEQWTVHMLPRRVPDASINPRGLMQAIRSFLYFSQLCAWYSLTGGKSPQNVHYRVCVPGEAFSSRFAAPPDCHIFPISNIGRNAAMKVLVKSHPRCGEIPRVPCHKHSTPLPNVKTKEPAESDEMPLGAEGEFIDGLLPAEVLPATRTSSPADSMLGESLLDPPNSLCMYPKRYQSPSRCGSPSLEVPEHLMFGKAASVSQESHRQRMNPEMHNRSRPHHRPVFQRVLEKKLSEGILNSVSSSSPLSSSPSSGKFLDNCHVPKSVIQSLHANNSHIDRDLTSYLCLNGDLKDVPKAEMESVLHKLRNSHCPLGSQDKTHYVLSDSEKLKELSSSHQKTKIPINKSGHPLFAYKPSFQQIQKSLLTYKPDTLSKQAKRSSDKHQHSKKLFQKTSKFCKLDYDDLAKDMVNNQNSFVDQRGIHVAPGLSRYPNTAQDMTAFDLDNGFSSDTYHFDSHFISQEIPPSFSGVNIKKCGALLESLTLNQKLIDERGIADAGQRHIKSKSPEYDFDVLDCGNLVIPSAEEKAQFRRSLDSATSLVFHQKSGLPLTSSPAPIRKSGTCFDFDSSLTTVSAIKKALFEKEPEDEDVGRPKCLPFSLSAPSSMTVSSLLGTFEESVLNGRLEPVSTVEGFTAEIGASGSFCPRHITLPVTIFFYTLQDIDKVTSPYLGHINLGKKDYHIPKRGTVQVTLFNPHRTVVKMFVVRYDLSDMPPNCQTFLRQRTLYMPSDASEEDEESQKWLRYLIHIKFASSKSGRIFLHTDIRLIIFRKCDLDAASVHGQRPYELKSFTQGPLNPKFSPRKL